MIWIEYGFAAPEFAKIVISTCSLTLNRPGLRLNSHFCPRKKTLRVRSAAMRWPRGTTAIWAEMAEMERGSRRYQKNWLRKDRRTQAAAPSTHIRKVTTGRVGSSVGGTVSSTCSTGEFSVEDASWAL